MKPRERLSGGQARKGDKPMKERMEYCDLVKMVEEREYRRTRFDVVAYLVGLHGYVDEQDYNNIQQLFADGLVD